MKRKTLKIYEPNWKKEKKYQGKVSVSRDEALRFKLGARLSPLRSHVLHSCTSFWPLF
jgi:hypothetical protein